MCICVRVCSHNYCKNLDKFAFVVIVKAVMKNMTLTVTCLVAQCTVHRWNSLLQDVIVATSIDGFKKGLASFMVVEA